MAKHLNVLINLFDAYGLAKFDLCQVALLDQKVQLRQRFIAHFDLSRVRKFMWSLLPVQVYELEAARKRAETDEVWPGAVLGERNLV